MSSSLRQYYHLLRQIYQNMLNPQDRSKHKKRHEEVKERQQTFKTFAISLQAVLQKPVQHRYQLDHQIIAQFLQQSKFFGQLSEQISSDFARNIVKKSKVYLVQGKKSVYQRGQKMINLILPLYGNTYLKRYPSQQFSNQDDSLQSVYKHLIQNANKTTSESKGNMTFQKRSSVGQMQLRTVAVPNWNQLKNLQQIKQEGVLMLGDLEKEKHTEDIFVNGEAWFLTINIKLFRQCLKLEYYRLIMDQAKYFRSLRCFDILENQQLKIFIQKINIIEYKKDDYIFRVGDKSIYLYLMIEGEAKASKEAQLFKQNPNCLYQRTVSSQNSRRSQRPQELSYVNFEGVFNYAPQKRRIQLGILSSITIFGQEQVTAGIPREADIQVTSTKVKLYRFTLKELQTSGSGRKIDTATFINNLFEATTSKRIVTRRESFRSSLQFQNRRSMNYFFIEPNENLNRKSRIFKDRINNSITKNKTIRSQSNVKPRYHSFNFNQFLEGTHNSKKNQSELSKQEKKIAQLTHTSNQIADQVSNSSKLYSKMKSYKHKINMVTPLFDTNYYKKQRKEALRVQNKRRMNMIAVKEVSSKSKLKMMEFS